MRGPGTTILKIWSCESYFSVFKLAHQDYMIPSTGLKDKATQKLLHKLF